MPAGSSIGSTLNSNPSTSRPVCRQVFSLLTQAHTHTHTHTRTSACPHSSARNIITRSRAGRVCRQRHWAADCFAAEAADPASVDSDVSLALIRISRRQRQVKSSTAHANMNAECSALIGFETDYCPSLCSSLIASLSALLLGVPPHNEAEVIALTLCWSILSCIPTMNYKCTKQK